MQISIFFWLTALTLLASFLFGGGARPGMLSDAILQLLSIPLLLCALWRWLDIPFGERRWAIAMLAGIAFVFSTQLLPLPPAAWATLSHSESIIDAFRSIDLPLPWRPLSVAPYLTISSALALICPVAVFLAAASLEPRERRRLALLLLPMSAFSVLLGLAQIAQGSESPLRFFATTNPTEAVGFFANRNHFAAFLYCSTVIAAAWFMDSMATEETARSKSRVKSTSFVAPIAAATVIVILMSGQAMARSRAGIALTFLALGAALALVYADKQKAATTRLTDKLLLGTIAFAVASSIPFALYRILVRFDADMLEDARWTIARRTIEAARAHLPLGAGIGTFVPVYANYERPRDALVNLYVNHAHNDLLELYLESGVFGVALAVAFGAWWAARSWRLWTGAGDGGDRTYGRAASSIIALLALHSLVDYPLRTTALATLFALSCALLLEPPARIRDARGREAGNVGGSSASSARRNPGT